MGIETERLRLRDMKENDKDNLLEIFSDPIAMKYYPSTKNEEETVRWITWTRNNYRKFGVGLWVVEDKDTGKFLGQCGIVPQKIDGEVQMEIGYSFLREVWGRGFATEAARACKEYGIGTLELTRIISLIDPENTASIKVANRIGMVFEKNIMKWGKTLALYAVEK
ncbi:GNAT family N-acetyltransferase [Aquibacillus albus]|uniref:RimJ/RimL family protein N-acetyltransferase n=1 Tax=Aquibacillus albus TaxID=1168171 RepID=A0ABS2N3A7_9BACI|nr:GNAT family N-acetyltransferase [Aquibacillus albus]MBM7572400.1 RimJ/RimL family protein N-acetyltransferase [Aquibacillus albus]